MSVLLPRRSFASLSVKDVLDAREAYHVHLLHLEHVVATAVGRYRFVRDDPNEKKDGGTRGRDVPRSLSNSEVRDYSWPCVLVFVDHWMKREEFASKFDEVVPPRLYLPDGRVIPTCVVLAEEQPERPGQKTVLRFPRSMLGGGYPSISEVQGETRFATIGCLVSDGDSTYALTNLHVAGENGRELFTLVNGARERLGVTSEKQVGKLPFEQAYSGFSSPRTVVNLDAALVRVDDLSRWTSQVYGIGGTASGEKNPTGYFDELADVNVDTVSLDLIGCEVRAFGAASGIMTGEIQGLFYRYRSIGGQDQLADFLIGPPASATKEGQAELAHQLGRHGNSGAVWFLVQSSPKEGDRAKLRPIGLHWGGQSFIAGDDRRATQYGLASSLGLICRELGVEIVRTINVGLPERWGKVGHYKVGQLACELVTDATLKKLLDANVDRISFAEEIDRNVASVGTRDEFVPLADVSDIVWKRGGQSVRGKEGPNHFADMDQSSDQFDGKTLLELSKKDSFLDPAKWNEFYESLDIDAKHRGLLPFRVWQLFDEMVAALKKRNIAGYIAAAGVLAHYGGDACQPLHVSMFHDGDPETGRGEGVHSAYETKMLDRFAPDLNALIDQLPADNLPKIDSGHDAAREIVKLMARSIKAIPPERIIDAYEDGGHRVDALWQKLGKDTAKRIHDGASTLAAIWQGAWVASGISDLTDGQLRGVSRTRLRDLYLDKTWAPSVHITDLEINQGQLVVKNH